MQTGLCTLVIFCALCAAVSRYSTDRPRNGLSEDDNRQLDTHEQRKTQPLHITLGLAGQGPLEVEQFSFDPGHQTFLSVFRSFVLSVILRKPAFVEGASGVVSGERSE